MEYSKTSPASRYSALAAICLLAGCATTPDSTRKDHAVAGQMADQEQVSAGLKPYHQRLYMEGETYATLNRMRLASAAIEAGEWAVAERELDVVLRDIEALGPADERSREALGKFNPEDTKRFKGEAHERSMACFLRGLLYLRKQDWSNARACFKNVQVQDAAKKDPALRGNWASADWLEGWCNQQLGQASAAKECWERASIHKPGSEGLAPPDDGTKTVCVALLGFGPVKIPKGEYGEHLTYRKGASRAVTVRLKQEGSTRPIPMAEDLLAQASSRGERHMDVVNESKADTRAAAETAGDVLIAGGIGTTVGGVVADDPAVAGTGLGVAAAGMVVKGVASSITPKADTRAWDLLPATIHIMPLAMREEKPEMEFRFLDADGKTVSDRKIRLGDNSASSLILLIER